MTKEITKTFAVDGQNITLNPSIVMNYMIDDEKIHDVPKSEMARVIMTCAARKLNPFTGDVVCHPRRDKSGRVTLSLVTTKDFFVRRAAANPNFDGMDAGIVIISADGRPVKRPGSAVYKQLGETLAGGWCSVSVKGWEKPVYAEVALDEYDAGFSIWKSKPATMIRKVAVSQALREAFPNDFGSVYEPEEMGIDEEEIAVQPAEPEIVEISGGEAGTADPGQEIAAETEVGISRGTLDAAPPLFEEGQVF